MDNNNLHLNISIDSLIATRYEEIRINGNFNKLIKNTEIFADYCTKNNRELAIMVNPMRNNWEEIHNFVKFFHALQKRFVSMRESLTVNSSQV